MKLIFSNISESVPNTHKNRHNKRSHLYFYTTPLSTRIYLKARTTRTVRVLNVEARRVSAEPCPWWQSISTAVDNETKRLNNFITIFLKFSSENIYEIHIFEIIVIYYWANKLFCLEDMVQSNEFYFEFIKQVNIFWIDPHRDVPRSLLSPHGWLPWLTILIRKGVPWLIRTIETKWLKIDNA